MSDVDIADADLLVGAPYMKSRRFFLSYSTNALFVQREQSIIALHDAVLPPASATAKGPAPLPAPPH